MTAPTSLAEYVARLATAIVAMNNRITEVANMSGMTQQQAEQLAQVVREAAELRLALNNLSATVSGIQTEVGSLRSDVAVLKQGVGDLSSLPPL